jgi:hypothetical protein
MSPRVRSPFPLFLDSKRRQALAFPVSQALSMITLSGSPHRLLVVTRLTHTIGCRTIFLYLYLDIVCLLFKGRLFLYHSQISLVPRGRGRARARARPA